MTGDDTERESAPETSVRPVRTVIKIDPRSIWHVIGAVLMTLAALWALNQASGLVTMVIFSIFLSLAMQPAVNVLHRRYGMRRGSAVGVIYLAGLLFIVGMVAVLIPTIAQLAGAISARGAEWISDLNAWVQDTFGTDVISRHLTGDITTDVSGALAEWAGRAFGAAANITTTGVGAVFWLATVAMFTFYFTAEFPALRNALLSRFRPEMQMRLGWTFDRAIRETGGYFYSRLLLMLINGIGFFITMALVGVPVVVSIALALIGSFIAAFIPVVGTYIGSALPVIVTLGFTGLVGALIVLAYAIVYQQIENYILSPRISANTMTLNGGLAFGAALFGGAIAGPIGAFMAMPIVALVKAFISEYTRGSDVVYVSPYDDPAPSAEPDFRQPQE